jgi:threonyl-tRNA synthetase
VSVITIADRHEAMASGIADFLKSGGIRVELDAGSEKIGYKIRQSSINKIPYAVIVGDKEVESGAVTVRRRDGENTAFESKGALLDFLRSKADNRDKTI